jgi:ribosomal-protein-alanine N-acetyltransferase
VSRPVLEPVLPPVLAPMRWWDIPALVELEARLFPEDSPWTPAMFWSELAAGHHYVVHRSAAGPVDGYAGLARQFDEAEVQTIGVDPAAQGTGLGRALLHDLLTAAVAGGATRVFLDVRTDNVPARTLYETEGFTVMGVRRRYYEPSGADAYGMVLDLADWTPQFHRQHGHRESAARRGDGG